MKYDAGNYDVAVVGAGHAGIEAALAAARLGCKTVVFTINMDFVGNCPCNPSIGGTAKGHLVREIDALGGEMGKTADECFLQSRMLNLGKGPAVHSLRVQIDRWQYSRVMKQKLEAAPGLHLRQAEVVKLEQTVHGWKLFTGTGAIFCAKAVVLATGTFLNGKIFIGGVSYFGGPDGNFPSVELSTNLQEMGIALKRFKTGTPARVLGSSIDFSKLQVQRGDEKVVPFSFQNSSLGANKMECFLGHTSEETRRVVMENLHHSPLYSGKIEGVGPRYCPSIEDKFKRFPDKPSHQFFVEPCGLFSQEMYLQGLSSSLPEAVQTQLYRSLPGFDGVHIMRPAYAIEYDCVDSLQLGLSLEFRGFLGLFGAGQFSGSSGYEEAAAQGLVAGINAAHRALGREKFVLTRENSYIGTLIDDLVTKGVDDPYRMMTSRSEHRLMLRQDNADERLTPRGRAIGLVSDKRWGKFLQTQSLVETEMNRIKSTHVATEDQNVSRETFGKTEKKKIFELLKQPQITYKTLKKVDQGRPNLPEEIFERVEIKVKYDGYIKKQAAKIAEIRRLEGKKIPDDANFSNILGLRKEAAEKLSKVRPENIGQAARVSGVNPADISVILIWLSKNVSRETF